LPVGPVFAAAVILDPVRPIRGLNDSKILEAPEREELAAEIKIRSLGWATGAQTLSRSIRSTSIRPRDGYAPRRRGPRPSPTTYWLMLCARPAIEQLPLIDGDARCRAIAAASILAKVHRDACLTKWHEVFPQYNLASNKGVFDADHRRALSEFGLLFSIDSASTGALQYHSLPLDFLPGFSRARRLNSSGEPV